MLLYWSKDYQAMADIKIKRRCLREHLNITFSDLCKLIFKNITSISNSLLFMFKLSNWGLRTLRLNHERTTPWVVSIVSNVQILKSTRKLCSSYIYIYDKCITPRENKTWTIVWTLSMYISIVLCYDYIYSYYCITITYSMLLFFSSAV